MKMIGAVIALVVAFWVYRDAKIRGKTTAMALLWFAGVFLLLILFLPLWFILRPKNICPHCNNYYKYKDMGRYCPMCNVELLKGE